ncbi:bacteriophage minor tail subunit [Mycolicibacterium conceptionense]|uniref:Bacteriophage minor tail subunit n=1 Tax=Mycolicibacterium conceptionense TaxID=451644 RepID=A0A0U1DZ57_9MYCO|nr:bacteriophage minor tail subunit [Mycolicibacterium conceptionense]
MGAQRLRGETPPPVLGAAGAFTNFTGATQRQTILSFTLEAQDYDYVPYVTGHLKCYGIESDATR